MLMLEPLLPLDQAVRVALTRRVAREGRPVPFGSLVEELRPLNVGGFQVQQCLHRLQLLGYVQATPSGWTLRALGPSMMSRRFEASTRR